MSDKLQYWINQNGVQAGPVTRDELAKMAIDSSAYVWCVGMDDWKPITEVEDLAGTYAFAAEPAAEPMIPPIEEPVSATEEVMENIPPITPEPPVTPTIPPIQQEPVTVGIPLEQVAPATAIPAVAVQQSQANVEQKPECPPTNLAWAIIATLLCCLPLGVVAIIYSTKVSAAYNQGDYEKAKRMSDTSAWWCIGSIVGGIIFQPISMLIQMAMMG